MLWSPGRVVDLGAAAVTEVLRAPANVDLAVTHGWADQEMLDAMVAELRAWAERPDAYWTIIEVPPSAGLRGKNGSTKRSP